MIIPFNVCEVGAWDWVLGNRLVLLVNFINILCMKLQFFLKVTTFFFKFLLSLRDTFKQSFNIWNFIVKLLHNVFKIVKELFILISYLIRLSLIIFKYYFLNRLVTLLQILKLLFLFERLFMNNFNFFYVIINFFHFFWITNVRIFYFWKYSISSKFNLLIYYHHLFIHLFFNFIYLIAKSSLCFFNRSINGSDDFIKLNK